MAAIAYPSTHDQRFDDRPALHLVRPVRHTPYARRRIVAIALAALLSVGTWTTVHAAVRLLGGAPLNATEQRGPTSQPVRLSSAPAAVRVHVVQPGDTLWSIARAEHPTGDIRAVVDQLAQGRGNRPLQAGEALTLP
jgi:hypothetical protein